MLRFHTASCREQLCQKANCMSKCMLLPLKVVCKLLASATSVKSWRCFRFSPAYKSHMCNCFKLLLKSIFCMQRHVTCGASRRSLAQCSACSSQSSCSVQAINDVWLNCHTPTSCRDTRCQRREESHMRIHTFRHESHMSYLDFRLHELSYYSAHIKSIEIHARPRHRSSTCAAGRRQLPGGATWAWACVAFWERLGPHAYACLEAGVAASMTPLSTASPREAQAHLDNDGIKFLFDQI